jgi:hypothetical protein
MSTPPGRTHPPLPSIISSAGKLGTSSGDISAAICPPQIKIERSLNSLEVQTWPLSILVYMLFPATIKKNTGFHHERFRILDSNGYAIFER